MALILGELAILIALIIYLSTESSNDEAAVRALRGIADAQEEFRAKDLDGDGFIDYASSLAELSQVGLIDGYLGSGLMGGYEFFLSGGTYNWDCSASSVGESKGTNVHHWGRFKHKGRLWKKHWKKGHKPQHWKKDQMQTP